MTEQAIVANVTRRVAATSLSSELLGGEVQIEVEDIAAIPEPPPEGIGQIIIAPGDPDSETLTYTGVDDDGEAIVLDAATPVVNAWDRGTDIQIWPDIMEHEAHCYIDGQVDGDPLVAHIPHAIEPLLPEGTRVEGEGETVLVDQRGLDWYVADVLGQAPVIRSGLVAWGGQTDDLVGLGLDDSGEQIAELSAGNPGFSRLYVGALTSPSVPAFGDLDQTYYVDPDDGDDDLGDGLTLATAWASIGEALRHIPRFNSGDVVILVTQGTVVSEFVDIESFTGSGSITIDGGLASATVLSGTLAVEGVSMDVFVQNLTIDDDEAAGDDPDGPSNATVSARNARHLSLDDVLIYSHGARVSNLFAQAANVTVLSGTEFHGATDQCVFAGSTAQVTMVNTKGSAASGTAIVANGSAVRLGGSTRPTGTLTENNGGRIANDASAANSGGASGGGTRSTRYWTPVSTGSWRNAFGGEWRTPDTDDVYQGSYAYGNHRGCWLYDYSDIQTRLHGRRIDAVYLLVRRKAEGGVSGSIPLRLWTHDRASRTGVPNLAADWVIGSMAWGGTRWIKVPNYFAERLRDGTGGAKGLALYQPDGSAYGIFAGKSAYASSGRLKVTSH